jgi:hypothetical protein
LGGGSTLIDKGGTIMKKQAALIAVVLSAFAVIWLGNLVYQAGYEDGLIYANSVRTASSTSTAPPLR